MTARLLLVDDDDTLRKLFGFALRHQGYEVEEAVNGLDGLSKVEAGTFDLMIIDVMMPMLDGIRFLAILREERKIDTPVLVLTSMDRAGADAEIRAGGANDVALKPISHTDLLERVKKLLEENQSNG